MFHLPFHFVRDRAGVERRSFFASSSRRVRTAAALARLNRHSRSLRQRSRCGRAASRSGASGCFVPIAGSAAVAGGHFPLCLADVLPRHTLTASLLWQWLVGIAGGRFAQGGGGKAAAALRAGNGVSVAARIAAVTGSGAHAALPGAIAAGQRAGGSVAANRGTSASGLSRQRVSAGGVSTAFSASVSGLRPRPAKLFWPNCRRAFFAGGGFRAGDNTTILCRRAGRPVASPA